MDPFASQMQIQPQSSTNLFSTLVNIAFGFVLGLVIFSGFEPTVAYGTKLAATLIKTSGYGQQMAAFGFATTAAPYVVFAPLLGLVATQLKSVNSIRGFVYFAAA